jgi:hypothetical protein
LYHRLLSFNKTQDVVCLGNSHLCSRWSLHFVYNESKGVLQMTRIPLSKTYLKNFLFRYFGWKALALAAITIMSLSLWQLSVARDKQAVSQLWSLITHTDESGKVPSSAVPRPANDVKLRAPYDLSSINADPSYYQRVDALRLYQMARIPAGQKRHEELRIIGDAFRLAVPQSWLEQPLAVLAKPGRPVTFVALDSGKFSNGEITITTKADADGLATAAFFVTNEGPYRVLAGSPENAGPAAFYVHCMSQTMRDELRSGRYAERYLAEVKANNRRESAAAAELVERVRQRRTIK